MWAGIQVFFLIMNNESLEIRDDENMEISDGDSMLFDVWKCSTQSVLIH